MGRRDDSPNPRRAKHRPGKSEKRFSRGKSSKPTIPKPEDNISVEVEDEQVVDEMECEDDTEVSQVDESDCVDVEGGEDEASSLSATPTPSTSKAAINKNAGKKTTPKAEPIKTSPTAASKAPIPANVNNSPANVANGKKSKRRRESGTSSEEERWLTAIESGKLEDVDDELKKIKDPKLMTARQRAMYVRSMDQEQSPCVELLMSLPTGYREKEKPQTAEDIQKAALKSQKRKQQADEKREKDKKKTMERLLKKQDTKQRSAGRKQSSKTTQPMISYRNTVDGAFIHLPPDFEFPLRAKTAPPPPKVQLCGIAGCGQPKVYSCSKTNLPLCSYACYRKNVQAVRQIMC